MLEDVLDRLLGYKKPRLFTKTEPLPIKDMTAPSILYFSLVSGDGRPATPLVKEGDEISAGTFLGDDGSRQVVCCPVSGKVAGVVPVADTRGAQSGSAVLVEPSKDTSAVVFKGLDPKNEASANLWDRIEKAGIITDAKNPRPLAEVIGPRSGVELVTLIISAADRDLETNSALQLFREKREDAYQAAEMLGRMTGAARVIMAVPAPVLKEGDKKGGGKVETVSVPQRYPSSLEPLLADNHGGGKKARVVMVETAIAALEAVRDGKVQDSKVVTFINPRGQAATNLRVPLGSRLKDVMKTMGLSPREEDKVVAGGPMRGFAQFSLDAAVDQGIDALMLVPSEGLIPWSDEPCVSSGLCNDVCPVNIQVSLINRYAEYGLYDQAEALGVMNCIECGLCASVCTARRPLVQFIRLAKREIERARAESQVFETEKVESGTEAEQAEA